MSRKQSSPEVVVEQMAGVPRSADDAAVRSADLEAGLDPCPGADGAGSDPTGNEVTDNDASEEDAAQPPRLGTRFTSRLRRSARDLAQRTTAGVVGRTSRPVVVGAEHLPTGAVLVAVNHPGRTDRALLEAALTDAGEHPRPVWFSALADADDEAEARSRLDAGEAVVVFVEGQRSPDGLVHRARAAVGALLTATTVPVVPAGVRLPVDRRGWLAASGAAGPTVEFAAPIDIERHREGAAVEVPALQQIAQQAASDAVLHAITGLAGRDYVDADAGERRVSLRRQAADDRAARAEAARAERAAAQRAREEAEQAARDDAARLAQELADAERAAREHAERAAREDAERVAALRALRVTGDRGTPHRLDEPRGHRVPPQPTEPA